MRVGIGFDVHRLVEGRQLIIGGVTIPYEFGLLGHSDADVLLHALADALLGAAGLGDIGVHFPDTDPRYAGISSMLLLDEVKEKVMAAGFAVNNVDAVIVAQRPKMAPYMADMRSNIARILEIEPGAVNIKATTTEGLGFAGRGEGIAAWAAVTLRQG
ncbi:MAG TPA: 2-C-methyl-D-erythritol 2,4-cyclodiphosphate synthase [Clostridia bacterium]|nr:2-C-methyl-D-erythritol 2,4-cyclodiphosphate synthase [Clostridia bacterium]